MTEASKKVGGYKKVVIDVLLFILVAVLFVAFMVPFLMTILNSFKVKMDILRDPLSLSPSKGFSLSNYEAVEESCQIVHLLEGIYIV